MRMSPQTYTVNDKHGILLVECYGRPASPRRVDLKHTIQRGHIDNDISIGGGKPSPSRCVVPFHPKWSEVVMEYLTKIQPGREGWVYLIHAQDTIRYKIGRSINPISRIQELQKQSPYPLEITQSFWAADAVVDEAILHERFNEYRVFGEWFEFSDATNYEGVSVFEQVEFSFYGSPTISALCSATLEALCNRLWLEANITQGFKEEVHALYSSLRSHDSIQITEIFLRETLPALASDAQLESYERGKEMERILFMYGALRHFALTRLNRKGARVGVTGRRGWEIVS